MAESKFSNIGAMCKSDQSENTFSVDFDELEHYFTESGEKQHTWGISSFLKFVQCVAVEQNNNNNENRGSSQGLMNAKGKLHNNWNYLQRNNKIGTGQVTINFQSKNMWKGLVAVNVNTNFGTKFPPFVKALRVKCK